MKKLLILTLLMVSISGEARQVKTSYYSHGKITKSGEKFNENSMRAASNTHKMGTILLLKYKKKSVKVCVNDTGGFKKYHRGLDVTMGVTRRLNFVKSGVVMVSMKILFIPKKAKSCAKT